MDEFRPNEENIDDPAPLNDHKNNEHIQTADINVADQPVLPAEQIENEEFAAEMTAFDDHSITNADEVLDSNHSVSSVPGWIGLALSILSFFMMPIIIGGAAIIIGFVARNRDAVWLGNAAIAIGAISIIIRLFFIPFA